MKNIIKILYSPENGFKEIEGKKINLFIPFLILILFSLLINLLYVNFIIYPKRFEIIQSQNLPYQDTEMISKFLSRGFLNFQTLFGTIIFLPIVILLISSFYHILVPLIGGISEFNHSLLYVMSSKFINIFAHYVKFPISLLTNKIQVHMDLAILFPFLNEKSFLYLFLSQIDIFTIYSLYIVACGMNVLSKVSKRNALIFVYLLWLFISIVISILGLKTRKGFGF